MNKDFDKMDELARRALENLSYDFNPEDWQRMEAKLNEKAHRNLKPLYWFKGLELSLVFLLGLGSSYAAFRTLDFKDAALGLSQEQGKEAGLLESHQAFMHTNHHVVDVQAEKAGGTIISSGFGLFIERAKSRVFKAGLGFASKSLPSGVGAKSVDLASGSMDLLVSEGGGASGASLTGSNGLDGLANGAEVSSTVVLVEAKEAFPLGLADLEGGGIPPDFALQNPKLKPFKAEAYGHFFLGVSTRSAGVYGQSRMGHFVGFYREQRFKPRWAWSWGGAWQQQLYELNQTSQHVDVEGRFWTVQELGRVRVQNVQAQVFASYQILESRKWRASGGLGLIMEASLHRQIRANLRSSLNDNYVGGLVEVQAERASLLEDRALLQAGALGRNVRLGLGLQVQAERQVSDNYALFIQPSYQQFMPILGAGLGDNWQFMLMFGLKTKLK